MSCNCACHDQDFDEEESDFECPECGEELNEDDECANEQCSNFECNPLIGGHDDDARWERQQMGVTS